MNGNEFNTNNIKKYIKTMQMAQGNSAYSAFYQRMRLYAMSLYDIENLPKTCNLRAFVNEMYYNGKACFFDTSLFKNHSGIVNMGVGGGGRMDIYGDYLTYTLTTRNGQIYPNIPRHYIVYARNTIDDTPLDEFIQYYALKMWTIEQTIDNNLYNLRNSNVWQCDESEVNTVRHLFQKVNNFEPVILGRKKLENIEPKNLMGDTKYHGKELSELKANVWAEFLTFLGLDNIETQKKAELKEAEVNKNNQLIRFSNNVFLQWWEKAINEANEKWGLSMSITVNAQIADDLKKEGDEIVNVHNDNETGG